MAIAIRPNGNNDSSGGGSGGSTNITSYSGNLIVNTNNQTTFDINTPIAANDIAFIYYNNLYLEKDINYTIVGQTVTVAPMSIGDVVSWIVIKPTPATKRKKSSKTENK